jgi:hypothetical protein
VNWQKSDMNEIEKNTSDDYAEDMLAESAKQDTTKKLAGSWFLLLALAIFANRFTNGDFQFVVEGLVTIGLVSFFLTK